MPQSRKNQVCLSLTPYYHCVSRCVRRAFLCGKDVTTGRSYEHRRGWVEKKLLSLSSIFAIDVCAYAVMHNHTHIVLHVDEHKVTYWSITEVLCRWHKLFKGTLLTQAYLNKEHMSDIEVETVKQTAEIYRQRLVSISWFMRVLNEGIARAANKEDECSGRFWEGRFKSQALLNEAAVIACMAYVDLNPIRAGIVNKLNLSSHTSIKLRIKAALKGEQPKNLMPFNDTKAAEKTGLSFNVLEYISLLEVSYHNIQEGVSNSNNGPSSALLMQLSMSKNNWLTLITQFGRIFTGAVGSAQTLTDYHTYLQHKRRHNFSICKILFS